MIAGELLVLLSPFLVEKVQHLQATFSSSSIHVPAGTQRCSPFLIRVLHELAHGVAVPGVGPAQRVAAEDAAESARQFHLHSSSLAQSSNSSDCLNRLFRPVFFVNIPAILSG